MIFEMSPTWQKFAARVEEDIRMGIETSLKHGAKTLFILFGVDDVHIRSDDKPVSEFVELMMADGGSEMAEMPEDFTDFRGYKAVAILPSAAARLATEPMSNACFIFNHLTGRSESFHTTCAILINMEEVHESAETE